MTEAMRDYLERRLVKVRSGYGASDVQVGIAGETDLSVWVRKLLVDAAGRARGAARRRRGARSRWCSSTTRSRTTSRSTTDGEAVVTLNNSSVLSPKLRYNVGDEGLTMCRAERRAAATRPRSASSRRAGRCRRLGVRRSSSSTAAATARSRTWARTSTRSTSSTASTATSELAAMIESFCLELEETADLESRPGRPRPAARERDARRWTSSRSPSGCALGLVEHLASASRDFAESLREDPSAARHPRVLLHDHGTGPFAGDRREDQERLRRRGAREDRRPEQGAALRPWRTPSSSGRRSTPGCAPFSRTGRSGSGSAAV